MGCHAWGYKKVSALSDEDKENIMYYESPDIKEKGFDYWVELHKDNYPRCFTFNGEKYANISFDSPFRVYGYPDTNEFIVGKESLLKFLKDLPETSIGYYFWNEELDECEWIEGYTEGLLANINNFMDKHGEENLIFDIG